MEHETAANQVASFELRKALEAYDWGEIDNICSNNVGNLSDSDISLWVRAKYMLGDFSKCYELCSTNFLDEGKNPTLESCRFMIRSAFKIGADETENSLHLFSENFPDDSEYMKFLMQSQYRNSEFNECISTCNDIIQIQPDNLYALRFRARSLTKIAKDQHSIRTSWEILLEENENDLEAINNIARTLISEGELDSASTLITRLVDIDPDYSPAKTTIAYFVSSGGGSDEFSTKTVGGYRIAYAKEEYTTLIDDLGGLKNWKKWNEDESVFIFRSLVKLERFEEAIRLFKRPKNDFSNSFRIISEVITSARETSNHTLMRNLLSTLGQTSSSDVEASKYYLRHLIYFEDDAGFVCEEVRRLLDQHDDSLLIPTLKFILKSGRYGIIEDSQMSSSISALLDPIHGYIANERGEIFSDLWEELNQKITHALSNKDTFQTNDAFNNALLESGASFPVLEENKYAPLGNDENITISEIDEICQKISPQAYTFDPDSAQQKFAIYCSKTPLPQEISGSIERIIILKINLSESGVVIKMEELSESGNEIVSEYIVKRDPRINMGRFHEITKHLGLSRIMIISSILEIISEHYPSEFWYDENLMVSKIAAKILGYPDDRIRFIE